MIGLLSLPSLLGAQTSSYEGEQLYQLKCGRCHFAHPPKKYSAEEWKTVLTEMGPLSGLTEESEKVILDYLIQASREKERGSLPTSPVVAGYLYTEFFSSEASTDTFDIHYLTLNLSGRLHDRGFYLAVLALG